MSETSNRSSALTVSDVIQVMEQIAPLDLSESWDNTGLLLGDKSASVARIMTCLTLTAESVREAIDQQVDLVISHHPLPFKPLAKITTDTYAGGLIWRLARAGINVFSPHTAWDSAMDGINAQLARKLSLTEIEPLIAIPHSELGAGRCGNLSKPYSLERIVERLTSSIPHCRPRFVKPLHAAEGFRRIAIGCGSGGGFLGAAAAQKCDLLVTGEATFHTCLEAQSMGIGLLMVGHFASEKFALDQLASRLASALPAAKVWGSRNETDPVTQLDGSKIKTD